MLKVVGLEVDRLRRIGIGDLDIAAVPVGKYVTLTRRQLEEATLTAAVLSKGEKVE